ncbi:MAG TPA: hypothetical protein VLA88_01980 [Candidatus Saccharimonadales bacterium]|nr:hypothetical protein [Candidatus Saccharimonadales bacterium]
MTGVLVLDSAVADSGAVTPATGHGTEESFSVMTAATKTVSGALAEHQAYERALELLTLLTALPFCDRNMSNPSQRDLKKAIRTGSQIIDDLEGVDPSMACVIASLLAEAISAVDIVGDRTALMDMVERSEKIFTRLSEPSNRAKRRHRLNVLMANAKRVRTDLEWLETLIFAIQKRD